MISTIIGWVTSGKTSVAEHIMPTDDARIANQLDKFIQRQWELQAQVLANTRTIDYAGLATCKNCGYESHHTKCPKCRGWKR